MGNGSAYNPNLKIGFGKEMLTMTGSIIMKNVTSVNADYRITIYYTPSSSGQGLGGGAGRANPLDDPKVRGILNAQAASVERVASMTMSTVNRRLERLHGDVGGFENGFSLGGPTEMPRQVTPYDTVEEIAKRGAGGRAIDASVRARDLREKAAREKAAPAAPAAETSAYSIWTAGFIMIGRDSYDGQSQKTRSTLSEALVGVDTRLAPGLKAGLAVGLSQEGAKIDDVGTKNDARGVTGTLYASWNATGPLFLDALLGYGDIRFKSSRFDDASSATITGSRPARLFFGSLTASLDQKSGPLSYAPYARLDAMDAALKAYTETGGDAALAFDTTRMRGFGLAVGLRGQYDIAWSSSLTVSPTGRLEYRRAMAGQATQTLSYANDNSTSYALERTTPGRNAVNMSLGLKVADKSGVSGLVEYLTSLGGGSKGHGLRGSVAVPF